MKHLLITSVILMAYTNLLLSQTTLYQSDGSNMDFDRVYNQMLFESTPASKALQVRQSSGAAGWVTPILTIAGAATTWGFKVVDSIKEKNMAKYKSEIVATALNLEAAVSLIPVIKFQRQAYENFNGPSSRSTPVISFDLTPKEMGNTFYYELGNLSFKKSDAKLTKNNPEVDLTIEVELTGANKKGEQTSYKAGTLSIIYNNTSTETPYMSRIKTSFIPRDIAIIEAKIKITETNSTKLGYDSVASGFYKAGEELGAIITVISESIPKEEVANED